MQLNGQLRNLGLSNKNVHKFSFFAHHTILMDHRLIKIAKDGENKIRGYFYKISL